MNIELNDEQRIPIKEPDDVYAIMQHILLQDDEIDRNKEHFWVMGLMADALIHYIELVSLGTLNASLVHPREVFRLALMKGTGSLILVHNHPSGNLMPSEPDIEVTKQLYNVGQIHGIVVQDHLIITTQDFYSMRAERLWQGIIEDLKYKPHYLIEYEADLKAKQQMARELRAAGVDVSIIARASGLTEEEIKKL